MLVYLGGKQNEIYIKRRCRKG